MTGQSPLDPADLAFIRARSDLGSADWEDPITDARTLLAEVDRLAVALAAAQEREQQERELREAFEGAAADLARAGIAERDALRKVVAIQEQARAALAGKGAAEDDDTPKENQ